LVKFLYARKGASEAETALLDAQKALPTSHVLRFTLGELYELNRRPEQARTVYEQARDDFRGKPAEQEAKVKLAGIDWSAGKREEAQPPVAGVVAARTDRHAAGEAEGCDSGFSQCLERAARLG
jgi:hypothetical protein